MNRNWEAVAHELEHLLILRLVVWPLAARVCICGQDTEPCSAIHWWECENAQHMYFIWYTTNEEGKGLDSSPQVLIFVLFEASIRLQKLQRGITSVFLLISPEAQRRCAAPRRWNETALSQLLCWGQGSPRPVKVCYKMFWYFWSDSFILHSSSWICKYRHVEKRKTFKNSSKLGFKQTASASTISSCLLSLRVFRQVDILEFVLHL